MADDVKPATDERIETIRKWSILFKDDDPEDCTSPDHTQCAHDQLALIARIDAEKARADKAEATLERRSVLLDAHDRLLLTICREAKHPRMSDVAISVRPQTAEWIREFERDRWRRRCGDVKEAADG